MGGANTAWFLSDGWEATSGPSLQSSWMTAVSYWSKERNLPLTLVGKIESHCLFSYKLAQLGLSIYLAKRSQPKKAGSI